MTELWRRGFKDVHAHIAALQAEGHQIEQAKRFHDPVHGETWGWVLLHDAQSTRPVTGAAADAILNDGAPTRRRGRKNIEKAEI